MYRLFAKLIILYVTTLTLGSCSGTQSFKDKNFIIDRVEVYEENNLLKNNPVNFIITTSPNKKIFGIPIGKILYETSHPEPKKQFENWLDKKKKRRKNLEKWIKYMIFI